jgi:hypothetical protein
VSARDVTGVEPRAPPTPPGTARPQRAPSISRRIASERAYHSARTSGTRTDRRRADTRRRPVHHQWSRPRPHIPAHTDSNPSRAVRRLRSAARTGGFEPDTRVATSRPGPCISLGCPGYSTRRVESWSDPTCLRPRRTRRDRSTDHRRDRPRALTRRSGGIGSALGRAWQTTHAPGDRARARQRVGHFCDLYQSWISSPVVNQTPRFCFM